MKEQLDKRTLDEAVVSRLAEEVISWMTTCAGVDPRRAAVLVEHFAIGRGRPAATYKRLAALLNLSESRVGAVLRQVEKQLLSTPPVLTSLEPIEAALIWSAQCGPWETARTLYSLSADPDRIADTVHIIGNPQLAALIRRHARPLEPSFVAGATGIVHGASALTVEDLHHSLRRSWSFETDDLLYACGADPDLKLVGDVIVSRKLNSPLAAGLSRALSSTNGQSVESAFAGAVRHLRQRRAVTHPCIRAFTTWLAEFDGFDVRDNRVETATLLETPDGLEDVLLNAIDSQSGLADQRQLRLVAEAFGYAGSSAEQYLVGSPIFEQVCAGVTRRRGAPVDYGRAEQMRRAPVYGARPRQWGRLGDDRLWMAADLHEHGLSPMPPADIETVLRNRTFDVLRPDRTPQGTLTITRDGIKGDLPCKAGARRPLLVFEFYPRPVVTALTAQSSSARNVYLGDLDGCVLLSGLWWAAFVVDENVLAGHPVYVPSALHLSDVPVGQRVELRFDGFDELAICQEMPGQAIAGLGPALKARDAQPGGWMRIALKGRQLFLEVGSPPADPISALFAALALNPPRQRAATFRELGAGLGLGSNADRRAVTDCLRRRGRHDLAVLGETLTFPRPHPRQDTLFVSNEDGRVVARDADGQAVVPHVRSQLSGSGPTILWVRGNDGEAKNRDPLWERWIFAWIGNHLTAAVAPPFIEVRGSSWVSLGVDYSTLLECLESSAAHLSRVEIPLALATSFPSSSLGFIQAVNRALRCGLRGISLTSDEIRTYWNDESTKVGSFLHVFDTS